jgi:uncharacterized repeat protein (TIGR03803 family)
LCAENLTPIIIAGKPVALKNLFENLNKNVIFNNMKNAPTIAKMILLFLAMIFAAANLPAQTFSTLHNFVRNSFTPNTAGIEPSGNLVFTNGIFYGTTAFEGSLNHGSIYSISEDGSKFNVICGNSNQSSGGTALVGETLYLTTINNTNGAIYSINLKGTNLNLVYSFTGSGNGAWPLNLFAVNNILYGITEFSSVNNFIPSGNGVFFSVDTNGNNFTILHMLPAPGLSLTFQNNTFYGTTGIASDGTAALFSASIGGNNYTNFCTFTNGTHMLQLIVNSNQIYGVGFSNYNSPSQIGIIFSMNTNGSNFNLLHTFTNNPFGLVLSDNLLFGSMSDNQTTLFSMKTNGNNFNILYNFPVTGQSLGISGLFAADHSIFGTAGLGGTNNFGSFFKLNPAPIIQNLNSTNRTANMTWSAASNAVYQLQYSTNLLTTNWFNFGNSLTATTTNLIFSDSITNSQRFYRLIYQP